MNTTADKETYTRLEINSGVARLTLARAEKRNALKRDFLKEIQTALSQIADDPDVRVFVLQADGSVFCAGMDLGEMQARAESADADQEYQRDSEIFCQVVKSIYGLSVPTIAAVGGPALAGGMGLVLACDIVVAADKAFFSLPEPARGITAAMVTPLLIHRVGPGIATYLLLSGERMTVDHARITGLCHDVVAADELAPRIDQLLSCILTGSRQALAITKTHIDDCLSANLPDLIDRSIGVSARARETEDAREGLAAFLEKRKPRWQPD